MLQVLGNYARVRHYVSLDPTSKKPKFEYHKQSLQHVKRVLDEPEKKQIDLIGQNNIDLNLNNNGFSNQKEPLRSSSSWLGHKPSKLAIPGSNPGDRTILFPVENAHHLSPGQRLHGAFTLGKDRKQRSSMTRLKCYVARASQEFLHSSFLFQFQNERTNPYSN